MTHSLHEYRHGTSPTRRFADVHLPVLLPSTATEAARHPATAGGASVALDPSVQRLLGARRSFERTLAMDVPTATLLRDLLRALARHEHVLLEGPPATAKSSIAAAAAVLAGLDTHRVNFSQSTDVAELIGAYRPDGQGGFAWRDGPILHAIREGGLLLLDELNLAPPDLNSRLLPLLEDGCREFRVNEREAEIIPVSPRLWVVATINPATHQGRRPLSGPLRSRLLQMYSVEPDVEAVAAMLRHVTQGRASPTVRVGPAEDAIEKSSDILYRDLGETRGWSELITPIARFFTSLSDRCAEGSIGRDRREPYVVDRRALARFVGGLAHGLHEEADRTDLAPVFDDCLERYLIGILEPGDRPLARDLAASLGLQPLASRRLCRPSKAPSTPLVVRMAERRIIAQGTRVPQGGA